MNCPRCKADMIPMITSVFCRNNCDLKAKETDIPKLMYPRRLLEDGTLLFESVRLGRVQAYTADGWIGIYNSREMVEIEVSGDIEDVGLSDAGQTYWIYGKNLTFKVVE
jgi:hypothetical protein